METLQGFTWEFLNALFVYDPEVNGIRRKITRSHNAKAGDVVGSVDGKGYLHVNILSKFVRVHHIVYFLHTKTVAKALDHHDRDRQNNSFENLRVANQHQNSGNIWLSKHNSSGFKGVSLNARSGKWHAQIKIHGKQTYLGRGETPEEAAFLYDAAARAHFGEFAVTNYEH